ncbi:MAG TPA: Rpn family recombination-promoting nuclease/putative transposase [Candidatus Mediterraneibacter intestinavium]|nr:Rpn family recombination-promoting nuclease/putative transposase [Candidatus Mediterraneibacter intestinavium]
MTSANSSPTKKDHTDDKFIMLPTVDVCFKSLMNNPKVRKGFIAALLNVAPETIAETTLLPTALRQDYPDDKLGILDVRVSLEDRQQFDMEMQVAYFEYWDARILFYLSKIFTDQLKKGEPYENLKKCIHVSILDFIYFEDDDDCHRTICFCDEKTGKKYTDLMEIQILELKKLPKELKNDPDILNWMRFLGGKTRREFEAMAKKDEYIEEAYRELEKLSADEQAKLEYEAREKAIRDHNSQMNSALKRGMEKGQRSLIRTMLKNGAEPDLIAKLTGLSLAEIKEAEKLPDSAS